MKKNVKITNFEDLKKYKIEIDQVSTDFKTIENTLKNFLRISEKIKIFPTSEKINSLTKFKSQKKDKNS